MISTHNRSARSEQEQQSGEGVRSPRRRDAREHHDHGEFREFGGLHGDYSEIQPSRSAVALHPESRDEHRREHREPRDVDGGRPFHEFLGRHAGEGEHTRHSEGERDRLSLDIPEGVSEFELGGIGRGGVDEKQSDERKQHRRDRDGLVEGEKLPRFHFLAAASAAAAASNALPLSS